MRKEKLFFVGVKGLVRDSEGKILVLKADVSEHRMNKEEYWDLPGGRIEHGITEQDTLKKEIFEETGVRDIRGLKYLSSVISNHDIPLYEGGVAGLVLRVWQVQIPEKSSIILSHEHVAFKWIAPYEAAALLEHKYPREFCEAVRALG